ncbi:porimin isoform X2 [Pseudopipra pipra]|uniref:porimin isoform X2 n=1 Tax=Pseudopipra pipra TaxID=415032 RepID=UPI0031389125
MRLLGGASCALLLLLLAPGSRNEDMNSTAPFTTISGQRLPDNSSSSNVTSVSSTQSAATSAGGVSTSTTHLTSTTQPTITNMSVSSTTQPTKTSQTIRSTTASSVTSSLYITVVTTSKISSTSVTATSKSEAVVAKTSRFDVGSFIGGIVLTLGVLVILYIGCKTYHSRRGIQYRTIDEHDAII